MFCARFKCDHCEFQTEEFVTAYIPDVPFQLVFQDQNTFEFRFLSFILPADEVKRMSDSAFEQMVKEMAESNRLPSEVSIDHFYAATDGTRLRCPMCREIGVRMHLEGII